MKLYIDDVRNAPDPSWTLVRTITGAIRAIAAFRDSITHISIDHDLGDSDENFSAVAYYIAEVYTFKNQPAITLHTGNPVGASDMQAIFLRNGLNCAIL